MRERQPRTPLKSLMLPSPLIDELDVIAEERSISRSAVARDLLRRGLEDYQREQRMIEAIRKPMSVA